jgi:polyphosphate kinase
MNILDFNLRDNVNAYLMKEDGTYVPRDRKDDAPFNVHKAFYAVTSDTLGEVKLF